MARNINNFHEWCPGSSYVVGLQFVGKQPVQCTFCGRQVPVKRNGQLTKHEQVSFKKKE